MTVNINGDSFTGTRDVLNLIAIYAAEAAEKYERENYPALQGKLTTLLMRSMLRSLLLTTIYSKEAIS